ncbi:hypothetical protein BKA93DRAFT_771703 [Sparassis latifolia]|uniref:Uncharacterized protein n=1 Tax=Sparassis crispa TaxID=139825 RepID=A0A401GMY9_9APHY|nr:hypothetical protein SCP_0506280 [Sparassis crispa]GBE83573.1 hypothetical protein SCP_0506280 [Sparassis crispa]
MPKTKGAKAKVGADTPKKKGKRTADETVDAPQAKPAKRAKATEESAKASASAPDKEAEIPEPKFSGNFDIYAATLPFLTKVCLPSGQTTPQYEELYKTILTYQAKPDSSGRCYLPAGATSAGKFECSQVEDPMSEEALDVEINFVTKEKKLSFTRAERGKFKTPGSSEEAPGISATTTLEGSHCGFDSAEGVFKMTRVWAKAMPTGEVQELFEGYFSLDVEYSWLYSSKGHGDGAEYEFGFWAVHARKNEEGEEIGLVPV